MKQSLLILCAALALTACNSRPIYFGSQRSTEGVPGFEEGKKTSPYVKLGKPYAVGGQVYIPRHQPDYDEEGEASWYGPGFHGGKTANGEKYDKYDFTAAHTTLPLPSVVKVTNLKNGKFVYVRVNDRGPFAEDRIIDLSKAAAEQIDMTRAGVVPVRVQYMPEASARVAEMMAKGRDPKTIDLAREVVNAEKTKLASSAPQEAPAENWWEFVKPIPSAQAAPPPSAELPAAEVASQDVATPAASDDSPFDALKEEKPAVQPAIASAGQFFVQLGSFSMKQNADKIAEKMLGIGQVSVDPIGTLYRVRVGPYDSAEEAQDVLQRVRWAAPDATLVHL